LSALQHFSLFSSLEPKACIKDALELLLLNGWRQRAGKGMVFVKREGILCQ
jgi:hypothetical protein